MRVCRDYMLYALVGMLAVPIGNILAMFLRYLFSGGFREPGQHDPGALFNAGVVYFVLAIVVSWYFWANKKV